ncbi:MAG: dethiobiotin synthase [Desulfobulbaceae bacterium]|uniref:ATP-dependent dethiobiotin synthetase BioD n=1 Tax=Candidatus Desulfobia pelagia TaxID=2841692 RepID=A0A8J6NA67_9BACT|nr:dethiobiotin synthase [Candidatus Desulfobia pelagia]
MELKAKSLFITGTDTNVGKTFICALLLGFLRDYGIDVGYQKWVSTGGDEPEDLLFCLRNTGQEFDRRELEMQVPYRFLFPASPHLSSEQEGKGIDPEFIVQRFHEYSRGKELLLVEGVGGLMVPLRRDLLLADFMARFKMPTLIVARSGLGTLNHTFLTIEALRSRNIPILGVVFSDEKSGMAPDDLLVADNMQTIAEMGKVSVFGRLLRYDSFEDARRAFQAIGTSILSVCRNGGVEE